MNPVAGSIAPDVPLGAVFDVALCAENEFINAVRLINVKLQSFRGRGIGDVKIHVVSEILDGIVAAKLLPPQRIRVRRGAGDVELGCLAIERGREHVLRHGVNGRGASSFCSSADGAVLPSGHLVDIAFYGGS